MWNQKIGISIENHYAMEMCDFVKMLRRIGFEAISPIDEAGIDLTETVGAARECGLEIQSLHAPFGRAADMWSREERTAAPAKSELLHALADCRRFEIPTLVVHTWIGFDYSFDCEQLYFGNFDELVQAAEKDGIRIAFENTEGIEYLTALLEHYKDRPSVGFCWDSGHEMCYNRSQNLLSKWGDRLFVTHLNDNLGISRFDGKIFWTDDLHLLPFDGVADWDSNVERLSKARPQEILNFELNIQSKPNRHENDRYGRISLEEFFTEAYQRACKIAYRYSGMIKKS